MTRNIDHIVETHRIAAERRRAGKPSWKATIKLVRPASKAAGETPDPAKCIKMAGEYEKILKNTISPALFDENNNEYDDDLVLICDDLRLLHQGSELRPGEHHINPVEKLKEIIEDLYDWADINRYWIEFSDPAPEGNPVP